MVFTKYKIRVNMNTLLGEPVPVLTDLNPQPSTLNPTPDPVLTALPTHDHLAQVKCACKYFGYFRSVGILGLCLLGFT